MKYCLCPGVGVAKGMKHYISAPMLARLYQVPIEECGIWEPGDPIGGVDESTVLLWPREDGKYEVSK